LLVVGTTSACDKGGKVGFGQFFASKKGEGQCQGKATFGAAFGEKKAAGGFGKGGARRPDATGRPPFGGFGGRGGVGGRGGFGDSEALFKKLDADGDGKVSKDEFKKVTAQPGQGGFGGFGGRGGRGGPGNKGGAGEVGTRSFDRLDSNGDGALSADEFKKMGEQRQGFGGARPGARKPDNKDKP
jgi:hypothetical protein